MLHNKSLNQLFSAAMSMYLVLAAAAILEWVGIYFAGAGSSIISTASNSLEMVPWRTISPKHGGRYRHANKFN